MYVYLCVHVHVPMRRDSKRCSLDSYRDRGILLFSRGGRVGVSGNKVRIHTLLNKYRLEDEKLTHFVVSKK